MDDLVIPDIIPKIFEYDFCCFYSNQIFLFERGGSRLGKTTFGF